MLFRSVEIEAFEAEDYEARLSAAADAGTLPELFESSSLGAGYMGQLEPLETAMAMIGDPGQYWFLDQYEELFPEKKQMPLCFQVPVVYVRTNAEGKEGKHCVRGEDLLIYQEMMGEECIEEYRQLAMEEGKDARKEAYELFTEGAAESYLSDTGDYRRLTEDLPAQFKVEIPKGDLRIRFDHLWSVSASSDKYQKKAAQWLLSYLLSGNAQSILGVRELEGVPMNRDMCEVFADVYQADLAAAVGKIPEAAAGGSGWLEENKAYQEGFE